MCGPYVVDQQHVACLPGLTSGVVLVGGVDELDDVLADRGTVSEAGVERQPVLAVDVHQVLAHLGGQRPLVEERDLVEPAAPAGERVPHDGVAALPRAQGPVGLPGEVDGVVAAVALDGGVVLGTERLGQGGADLVVVTAREQPALALEPLGQRGGQRLEHPLGVGHRGRPALAGRAQAGEQHQAGELQPVAQLVVHAHRLIGRPGGGGVQPWPADLPGSERLPVLHRVAAQSPEDGTDLLRRPQSQAPDEQCAVLRDLAAQRLAVLGRPGGRVTGGVDTQDRGLAGVQIRFRQGCQERGRHRDSFRLPLTRGEAAQGVGSAQGVRSAHVGEGEASSSAASRTACAAASGRVRGK